MARAVLGIVGGSAMGALACFVREQHVWVATPWGQPSAPLHAGRIGPLDVLYLARHGEPHTLAPHRVNYRANVHALHARGATHVLALNTVGGVSEAAQPGTLWLPDQLIDYTWGRESSFHDGVQGALVHAEFGEPYDAPLRALLARAGAAEGIALHASGVYGCTQGPRLETAAEVRRLRRDGCDLVGMTGMPEAALARELGLPYACLAMVVNPAAGLAAEPITLEAIHAVAAQCATQVERVIAQLARLLPMAGC
jgi:5'-deoxy-5'-methylthioadenosine phosphorylase